MNEHHAKCMKVKYPWLEHFLERQGLRLESVSVEDVHVVLRGDRNLFDVIPRVEGHDLVSKKTWDARWFWSVNKKGVYVGLSSQGIHSNQSRRKREILAAPPIGKQLMDIYGHVAGLQEVKYLVELNGKLSHSAPFETLYSVYVYHMEDTDWSQLSYRMWGLGLHDFWPSKS